MKGRNNGEERTSDVVRIVGLMLLVLALILLVSAALLQGVDKSQIGVRLVLIIIGAVLTSLGAAIVFLKSRLKR